MTRPANYIVDLNRFHLAGPPTYWLRQLWEFDNSLVVVPSRQAMVYRLAQKRKLQLPEHLVNDMLFNESDTKMLAQYSLVPVTTITATANWSNPYMFVELASRAPWRQGGAEKVNAMLEAQDKQDELDRAAKTDEHLDYLSKDAWGLYNKKIGLRSHMWSPKTKGAKSPGPTFKGLASKPRPTQPPSAIFLP